MSWSESLSLRGRGRPFSVLPSASKLLGPPTWVNFEEVNLKRTHEQYAERDPYPIPEEQDREGYQGGRHHDYWLNGLLDYLLVLDRLDKLGISLAAGDRVVDLGCASGRVLRHFACQFPPDHDGELDLWGIDVNRSHIDWIDGYLPRSIKMLQNHALPSLPLEDRSVSLLYGFSVFTHIDEFELAWLAEIRRVIAPGGVAYLTIHSDHTWASMNENYPVYQALLRMNQVDSGRPVTPSFLAGAMPVERIAFVAPAIDRVYDKNVFHAESYIHRVWGRFFNIAAIYTEGSSYQDVIVAQRPKDS